MSLHFHMLRDQQHHKTGQLVSSRTHQLSGNRFDELWLTGTLQVPTNAASRQLLLVELHGWLERTQGCITVGDLRRHEPTGKLRVLPSEQPQALYLHGQLLCADDFLRLYNILESRFQDVKRHDDVPA
jgi:hypothetical protein